MPRILIADDSRVYALFLRTIFEAEPDMTVVGVARNGAEAVKMTADLKPDIVTMDIQMPEMDGFEATCAIMSKTPVPIVVISSTVDDEEMRTSFRALEQGALAVLAKPPSPESSLFEAHRRQIVETVRAMAEVRVVRRRTGKAAAGPVVDVTPRPRQDIRLVAIGCSTGGPQALHTIVSGLPGDFGLPVVVVQHIASGFIGGLISWLGMHTRLRLKLVEEGEQLQAGTVYFAPDDRHLHVERRRDELVARLLVGEPLNGFMPSVTTLFGSVARNCAGKAIGALLTGMGKDGAAGLLEMRQTGCHTIVQDEASSIVYGMPGEALALGAADQVVPLERMASYIAEVVGNRKSLV